MLTDQNEDLKTGLLASMLKVVPLDGWSEKSLVWAIQDSGADAASARVACPRGVIDLAAEFHRMGDEGMINALEKSDLENLRYSDRVAEAVWQRCLAWADHKEAARRVMALFALPINCAEGSVLMWKTADRIWCHLGDTSSDINWYSKRMILSAVLASTTLYMVGDQSESLEDTRGFVHRRISDVMRLESLKARARKSAILEPTIGMLSRLTSNIRKPARYRNDFPGMRRKDD